MSTKGQTGKQKNLESREKKNNCIDASSDKLNRLHTR